MQIQEKLRLPTPVEQKERDTQGALQAAWRDLVDILNGGIRFSDNFDAQIITYTSNGVADTEDEVSHTIGRVPIGFIVLNRDKAGIVYDSGTAWTALKIFLKCSAATTVVKLLVF